jgi:hypothetical protein
MTPTEYHFLREIEKFNLDLYDAHLGWISPYFTAYKIYSKPDTKLFYLHDEAQGKLFEFSAERPDMLKSAEEYHSVVHAYLAIKLSNNIDTKADS